MQSLICVHRTLLLATENPVLKTETKAEVLLILSLWKSHVYVNFMYNNRLLSNNAYIYMGWYLETTPISLLFLLHVQQKNKRRLLQCKHRLK